MNIGISKYLATVSIFGCFLSGIFLFSMASADDKVGIDKCTERYNLCIEAGQTFYERCIANGNVESYCAEQQSDGAKACKSAMENCWKEKNVQENDPCSWCVCSGGTIKPECEDCCK